MERRLWLMLLLFVVLVGSSSAGEVVLTGVYKGKDIFVQNPFSLEEKRFCTEAVYVNDKLVLEYPRVSAFTIKLSHLYENEPVVIRIKHYDFASPKVINPKAVLVEQALLFTGERATDLAVFWNCRGEEEGTRFFLEQLTDDTWFIIDSLRVEKEDKKGYFLAARHLPGENAYRIMAYLEDGTSVYSDNITYRTDPEPTTFYPIKVSDKITMSKITDYKIVDAFGNILLSGRGQEIILDHLTTGLYYLDFENRRERFFKK